MSVETTSRDGMRVVGIVQRQRGMDIILGQQLYNRVRRLGFTSMASEGQTCMFEGGSPAAEAYRLTWSNYLIPAWPRARSARRSLRIF